MKEQIHKNGIEVRFDKGDLWLTQKAISELYDIDRTVVTKHLKNIFDEDYFETLLVEIREIRLSERRFYQKITNIYATSIDYDRKSPITICY